MIERWNRWRRRQPSRIRFVLVPTFPRLTAGGVRHQVAVVELRIPPVL